MKCLCPALLAFPEAANVDFGVVILIFNLMRGIGMFSFPVFLTPVFIMKIVLTHCCA